VHHILKMQFSKAIGRVLALIMLGGVLFVVAPVNRVTTAPLSSTSPAASPTPVPTREASEEKPNPLRRFFSWVVGMVTRPFRRREWMINDPPVVNLTSSKSAITECPVHQQLVPESSCSPGREVELSATVGSPEIDAGFLFSWRVTGGNIRGEGPKVTWDLSGLADGAYTATVEALDSHHLSANAVTTVTIARCSSCMTIAIPCPTASVSCPSAVSSKQPIVFEASVSGGHSPTYTWSITAGKIISGQGTSKITVDASNLVGQSLTATVTVGGLNPGCRDTASCTILDLAPQQH